MPNRSSLTTKREIKQMRIFHCDACSELVYFENTSCPNCGTALAYLPDVAEVRALNPAIEDKWQSTGGAHYRLCQNYSVHNICNWALPVDNSDPYCISCRLTRVIPDLRVNGNRTAWAKFEAAKRRLNYSLLGFGLPVRSKAEDPQTGVSYEFLADFPGQRVLTGHEFGVTTINVAEADDAERERRRMQPHEPYRTILGHFRHEIGHYYWDRFFVSEDSLAAFRSAFGDESQDYAQALKRHYDNGGPAGWPANFISSYATAHPWEDWAEPGALSSHDRCAGDRSGRRRVSQTTTRERTLAQDFRPRADLIRGEDRKLVLAHIHAQQSQPRTWVAGWLSVHPFGRRHPKASICSRHNRTSRHTVRYAFSV